MDTVFSTGLSKQHLHPARLTCPTDASSFLAHTPSTGSPGPSPFSPAYPPAPHTHTDIHFLHYIGSLSAPLVSSDFFFLSVQHSFFCWGTDSSPSHVVLKEMCPALHRVVEITCGHVTLEGQTCPAISLSPVIGPRWWACDSAGPIRITP